MGEKVWGCLDKYLRIQIGRLKRDKRRADCQPRLMVAMVMLFFSIVTSLKVPISLMLKLLRSHHMLLREYTPVPSKDHYIFKSNLSFPLSPFHHILGDHFSTLVGILKPLMNILFYHILNICKMLPLKGFQCGNFLTASFLFITKYCRLLS